MLRLLGVLILLATPLACSASDDSSVVVVAEIADPADREAVEDLFERLLFGSDSAAVRRYGAFGVCCTFG